MFNPRPKIEAKNNLRKLFLAQRKENIMSEKGDTGLTILYLVFAIALAMTTHAAKRAKLDLTEIRKEACHLAEQAADMALASGHIDLAANLYKDAARYASDLELHEKAQFYLGRANRLLSDYQNRTDNTQSPPKAGSQK